MEKDTADTQCRPLAAENGSEGHRHSPEVTNSPQVVTPERVVRHSQTAAPATRVSVSLGGLTISW